MSAEYDYLTEVISADFRYLAIAVRPKICYNMPCNHGARAWIWSDYLWHHRDEYLRRMPKSVLQSNWYYRTDFSEEICSRERMEGRIMASAWPEAVAGPSAFIDLEAAGFDQVPCGSIWATEDNMAALVPFCR